MSPRSLVRPESAIRTIADLRGKRIGVRNQGDIGRYVIKTMLRELGLDDAGTDYIAVGDGGSAGTALQHDQVDAIASYDTACARVELAGFKLRLRAASPSKFAATPSGYFGFSRKVISEKRRELVGFMRALAEIDHLLARPIPSPASTCTGRCIHESRPKFEIRG